MAVRVLDGEPRQRANLQCHTGQRGQFLPGDDERQQEGDRPLHLCPHPGAHTPTAAAQADAYTNTNSHTDAYAHTYPNTHAYPDANSNSNAHTDSDTNSHAYSHAQAQVHPDRHVRERRDGGAGDIGR